MYGSYQGQEERMLIRRIVRLVYKTAQHRDVFPHNRIANRSKTEEYCLGKQKKFHAAARVRTQDLLTGRQSPNQLGHHD